MRRILRLILSVRKGEPERKGGAYNTVQHQQTAYDVAAEAMVLLKNEEKLLPLEETRIQRLLVVGPNADAVIYCGGLNHSYGCESFDKKTMALPAAQDALIPKLLKENTNTVVVLTAGSPVEMPWIRDAKAVIWSWYAGMEGGHALADILFGKLSPSGKLPFTLPIAYEDTPVARYGEYKAGICRYKDGILVGYRGFDYDGIAPLFPFGHGLSYSAFSYSDLQIKPQNHGAEVTFTVTNAGDREAKETAQLYIGDPQCSVLRPPKELRNFVKVQLLPGESRTVPLSVTEHDLSFYDETAECWTMEPGQFHIFIGSSSGDIRLQGCLNIKGE